MCHGEILNDPSHPYNIYENATEEERAALDQTTYEQVRRNAEQWIKHKRRLAESEDKPKGTELRAVRSAGDQVSKEVGGADGVKQVVGAADVFEQTLDQLNIATDNPDAIAGAVMSPVFHGALKRNMERYLGGVAKLLTTDIPSFAPDHSFSCSRFAKSVRFIQLSLIA